MAANRGDSDCLQLLYETEECLGRWEQRIISMADGSLNPLTKTFLTPRSWWLCVSTDKLVAVAVRWLLQSHRPQVSLSLHEREQNTSNSCSTARMNPQQCCPWAIQPLQPDSPLCCHTWVNSAARSERVRNSFWELLGAGGSPSVELPPGSSSTGTAVACSSSQETQPCPKSSFFLRNSFFQSCAGTCISQLPILRQIKIYLCLPSSASNFSGLC